MTNVEAIKKQLPEGWSAETRDNEITIVTATGRAVTIDVRGRFFQFGFGIHPPRPYPMAAKYVGRGWSGRLVVDAINALGVDE